MASGGAPYPLEDRPLDVGDGHTVRLYNVIRMAGVGVSSLGVQYGSAFAPGDREGRRREAEAVIRFFEPLLQAGGVLQATAQVCGTPGQAAMREAPEQIFVFEHRDGAWIFVREAGEASHPSRPSA